MEELELHPLLREGRVERHEDRVAHPRLHLVHRAAAEAERGLERRLQDRTGPELAVAREDGVVEALHRRRVGVTAVARQPLAEVVFVELEPVVGAAEHEIGEETPRHGGEEAHQRRDGRRRPSVDQSLDDLEDAVEPLEVAADHVAGGDGAGDALDERHRRVPERERRVLEGGDGGVRRAGEPDTVEPGAHLVEVHRSRRARHGVGRGKEPGGVDVLRCRADLDDAAQPVPDVAHDRRDLAVPRAILDRVAGEAAGVVPRIGHPPGLPGRLRAVGEVRHGDRGAVGLEEALPGRGVAVVVRVRLPEYAEYILVESEHQVEPVLLDAVVLRTVAVVHPPAARPFPAEPPSHLVDGDVVRGGVRTNELPGSDERGSAAAEDGDLASHVGLWWKTDRRVIPRNREYGFRTCR